MRAERLVNYLTRVNPKRESEDSLRLSARICQLLEIMQASREGWGPRLSASGDRLAESLADRLNEDLRRGRHSVSSLAVISADSFVARILSRLRDA